MKNKTSLLALLLISTVFSCKKDNVFDDPGVPVQLTLLTKVSGQTSFGTNGVATTVNKEFFYDNSYRLVKIKDGKKNTNLSYNNEVAYEINHSDSSGIVVTQQVSNVREVISPYPSITRTEELSYEGGKLISTTDNKYTYTNGLLTEVTTTAGGSVQQTKKYTYTGNNITSYDDGRGNVYNYKYIDKLNPYANKLLKHLTGETDFISTNLVSEIEYGPAGSKTVIKAAYTYNEQGYPLTAKFTNTGGTVVTDLKFDYRRVTLGTY